MKNFLSKILIAASVISYLFYPMGAKAALTSGLVAYWTMDETSGTRSDSVGTKDLTDNNTVGYATGLISNAANFIRANSENLTSTDTAFELTGDFTVSFWFKPSTLTNYNVVWNKGSSGSEGWIYTQGDGSLVMEVGNYYAYNSASKAAGTLVTGNWYHIVAWRNATTGQIGLAVNDGTPSTSTAAGTITASATGMYIGSSNGGNYVDGDIDEFGFWSRVLTSGEITSLYNSGAGLTYPFGETPPTPAARRRVAPPILIGL